MNDATTPRQTVVASNFPDFAHKVQQQFERLTGAGPVFRSAVDPMKLWDCYLDSFPAGTNGVFRKRREHDCSCCRQFIRSVGNVVGIRDGQIVTLWDLPKAPAASYATVAAAMATLVRQHAIADIFLAPQAKLGQPKTYEETETFPRVWHHFHATANNSLVQAAKNIPTMLGAARTHRDVLLRTLREIPAAAVDKLLEAIRGNRVYRGEDSRHALEILRRLYDEAPADALETMTWLWAAEHGPRTAMLRNSAIGTLLVDLSRDVPLDTALRAYERVTDPTSYRRSSAPVSTRMVDAARAAVADLGLTAALERRYATLADVSVNDVLYADRRARRAMAGDAFAAVAAAAPAPKLDNVPEVSMEAFLADVLPRATLVEALVEPTHASHFVSLIAPEHKDAGRLFAWPNGFSWSYAGDVTDSIKERVKRAGGSVVGDLCCRLAWFNYDDLDLHMVEPRGSSIYYGNKQSERSGGHLDVDMNAGFGKTRSPVENIVYRARRTMPYGRYQLRVHQFCLRDRDDVGFEVEIDVLGTVHYFRHDKAVRQNEIVDVAEFEVSGQDGGLRLLTDLPTTARPRTVWGIDSGRFHPVHAIMFSPNHWGDVGAGLRHLFFMLDNCRNDGSARGFYTEFLAPELHAHRKVLEQVGARMRTTEQPDQLSGLGFTNARGDSLVVRVTTDSTRVVRVRF